MSAAEPLYIPRKLWTRVEVDRLNLEGLSLELVNGELIDKMGKKPPHILWKAILGEWLRMQFGDRFVRTEDPIDVSPEDNPTSEPEPDLAVTYTSIFVTGGVNPKPDDLRLVVEISDATYDFDTKVKASLYARAGIREYWIIDVRRPESPQLLLHRHPQDGRYELFSAFGNDEDAPVLDGFVLRLSTLA